MADMTPAPENPSPGEVSLREYIESILAEQRHALSVAEATQRNALRVAEEEREKSARALRIEMDRAVREGDERLREHIANQISQIRGDLISSEKLEIARVDKVEAKIESARREIHILLDASRIAIDKAEHANDRRLGLLNEFRAQMSDESKKYVQRVEFSALKESTSSHEWATKETVEEKYEAALRERQATSKRLSELDIRLSKAESRAAAYAIALGVGLTVLMIVITVVSRVLGAS